MRKLFFNVFLCGWLFYAAPAFADSAAAKAAFAEGARLFENEAYVEAADAFRRAHELEPSWKILYNIAQCDAAGKHYGRAMEEFEKFLTLGGDEVSLERRNEVEKELDRLRRMVGYLEIIAPDGAVIIVDGAERGTAPLAGKLMVSASVIHDLRIKKDNTELLNRKIQVSGTQSVYVNILKSNAVASGPSKKAVVEEPVKDATLNTVPQQPESTEAQKPPLKAAGIITASLGGALLITGAITGGLTLHKSNELASNCPDKQNCNSRYENIYDSGKKLEAATNVLLLSGTILAATGVALLIVDHRKHSGESIAATPLIGADMAGIAVHGKF